MNERIKQLAEQAGANYYSLGNRFEEFDEHKFSQLIVAECAQIAYKTSWDDLVLGYGRAVIPIHLHNAIKEHFGVEP